MELEYFCMGMWNAGKGWSADDALVKMTHDWKTDKNARINRHQLRTSKAF